jgi:hypothetical protein
MADVEEQLHTYCIIFIKYPIYSLLLRMLVVSEHYTIHLSSYLNDINLMHARSHPSSINFLVDVSVNKLIFEYLHI